MNKRANIVIHGSCRRRRRGEHDVGPRARQGDASASAGATGCGGLLRDRRQCVDALRHLDERGIDIVVKGSVGHMSAFMAQAGSLVVLGDAGDALGDSLYEARLFVRGKVKSLGSDCIEKPMRARAQRDARQAAR